MTDLDEIKRARLAALVGEAERMGSEVACLRAEVERLQGILLHVQRELWGDKSGDVGCSTAWKGAIAEHKAENARLQAALERLQAAEYAAIRNADDVLRLKAALAKHREVVSRLDIAMKKTFGSANYYVRPGGLADAVEELLADPDGTAACEEWQRLSVLQEENVSISETNRHYSDVIGEKCRRIVELEAEVERLTSETRPF